MPRWNSSFDTESVTSPLSGLPDNEVEAKLNELAEQHGASVVSAEREGSTWNVTFEGGEEAQQSITQLGAQEQGGTDPSVS